MLRTRQILDSIKNIYEESDNISRHLGYEDAIKLSTTCTLTDILTYFVIALLRFMAAE